MGIKKLLAGLGSSLLLTMTVPAMVLAATTTATVTPLNSQGWVFNPDPANATPYEFNQNKASIGEGSLYVKQIGTTPAQKFIASKTLNVPVADINSISYDFLIAGDGTIDDADQFYLNVYTNLAGSTTFYDCRYDYVPSTGSITNFTTATFNASSTPTTVGDRADDFACPATLDLLPVGSTVKFIAINVGDTGAGANDAGLAGYLDKAVINTDNDVTTYDFEPLVSLSNKDDCKKDGWQSSNRPTFKNQGDCVSYFASKKNSNATPHFAYGSVTLSGPTQQLNFSATDNGASGSDQGSVYYFNPSARLAYSAPLTCASVVGDTAYFAYMIPADAPVAAGTWVVWKVVDGVADAAGFTTAPDMASANNLCELRSATTTNYPITVGDIVVQ